MRETGVYQTLGDVRYFVPHPLPPANPPLQLNAEILALYGDACLAVGQLNEMALRLPDPHRFMRAYIIKEALLSSAIEGIHTTLLDVFTQDLDDPKPSKDTQLVLNYGKALEASLTLIQEEGLPLVTRVILKAHEVLMSLGDGEKANPGQFRKQSVRVGELIPAPPPEVPGLIQALEMYMNETSDLPPLIRAGLAHSQFETIHPFLDGNGRIGRLLIVLMLIKDGVISLPIIYPSYYFKKHHAEYYSRLDNIRTKGDYEGWVLFYLKAIRDSAEDAHKRAKDIEALEAEIQNTLENDLTFKKMRTTAAQIVKYLFQSPITHITEINQALGKSYNTVQHTLNELVKLGLVTEQIIHKRNKRYHFTAYLSLLEKEYS